MRGASIEDRRLPVNAKARARMYRPIRAVPANPIASLRRRYADLRPDLRERLPAIALTLAFELLLVLALLSLGSVKREVAEMRDSLVAFTAPNTEEDEAEEPAADAPRPSEAVQSQPDLQSSPEPVADRPQTPPAPAPRPILRSDFSLESLPQATSPRADAKPQSYGPAFTPSPGDTPRVSGSGPNGEPLYAARWYRRPYDDELAGYLSTARGPGWGLIDCRTVADFRVEDCVVVGESPQGSGIGKAVQAAAWQFKVRPPQRAGRPMVGEWVRIRIFYEIEPGAAARLRFGN
ncbi:hypothetical protein [Erythrobacter aureus]|uniref:hypothetical protein n=1 Tax=Erythrobacter aureus TaxID=2182384 RepID=UPI003A935C70